MSRALVGKNFWGGVIFTRKMSDCPGCVSGSHAGSQVSTYRLAIVIWATVVNTQTHRDRRAALDRLCYKLSQLI